MRRVTCTPPAAARDASVSLRSPTRWEAEGGRVQVFVLPLSALLILLGYFLNQHAGTILTPPLFNLSPVSRHGRQARRVASGCLLCPPPPIMFPPSPLSAHAGGRQEGWRVGVCEPRALGPGAGAGQGQGEGVLRCAQGGGEGGRQVLARVKERACSGQSACVGGMHKGGRRPTFCLGSRRGTCSGTHRVSVR